MTIQAQSLCACDWVVREPIDLFSRVEFQIGVLDLYKRERGDRLYSMGMMRFSSIVLAF